MSSQLVSYHTDSNTRNTFAVPTTVQTTTIGGRTLRYGPRPRIGGWFVKLADTGEYLPLPTYAAVRHTLSELRKKHEPTPPTTPAVIAPVCEGWQARHFNLPTELQDTPATHYAGTRKVCVHCYIAYQQSQAIVAKREAEARTVARVAACADEGAEKEHIVKVDATPQRPEWAQPLPKPTNIPDTHYAAQCRKCSGSGIYAMMVRNGQPWSTTGTTCYPCNGRGWVLRRKPSKRNKPAKTQPVPSGTVSAKSVMESPAWQAGRDEAIEQMINRRRESREQLASDIEQRKAAK